MYRLNKGLDKNTLKVSTILKKANVTYSPRGSYSHQTVMNSLRWWEPRMDESLVR